MQRDLHENHLIVSWQIFIDREAREIMYLVVSVPVCPSVRALTAELFDL